VSHYLVTSLSTLVTFRNVGGCILYLWPERMRRCQGCHYGQTLNWERQFLVLRPFAAPRLSYARRTASANLCLELRLGILRYESRGRESGMIVEHLSIVAAAAGPLLLGSPRCLAPKCKCTAQPTVQGCTCARL
jgi:hypothetical protein